MADSNVNQVSQEHGETTVEAGLEHNSPVSEKPPVKSDQSWLQFTTTDAQDRIGNGLAKEQNGNGLPGISADTVLSHNSSEMSSPSVSVEKGPLPPPKNDRPDRRSLSATENDHSNAASTVPNGNHPLRPNQIRPSLSPAMSTTQVPVPLSSIIFVVSALEQIAMSKEARRRKPLNDAVQLALKAIKDQDGSLDPEVIFEPLRLATETGNLPLTTAALDCIGKLISYSYFSLPSAQHQSSSPEQDQQLPLIDRAIETICDCFQDEATPVEIQLQIVKSLLAAVLNDKFVVHGSGLLKAIRQVYNIFLLSRSSANQQVAQGTLSQMVGTVFERVTTRLATKEARVNMSRINSERGTTNGSQVDINGSNSILEPSEADGGMDTDGFSETNSTLTSDRPVRKEPGEKLTLQSFENVKSFDDAKIGDNAPTMVTRTKSTVSQSTSPGQQILNGDYDQSGRDTSEEDEEDEIFVKDAYLVFRSMCRLSIKQLDLVQQQDIKSSNMRSKLVSLAIIRTLLNNNMIVFTSPLVTIRSSTNNEPTSFGQAINQYLRLSLSKNGASSVRQVFECCCEIFWLMLKDMRVPLKV